MLLSCKKFKTFIYKCYNQTLTLNNNNKIYVLYVIIIKNKK